MRAKAKNKKNLHGIAHTLITYRISKKFSPIWFQIAHNSNYLPVFLSVSHLCCLTHTFGWKQRWKWTCGYPGEAGTGSPGVTVALWNDVDDVWYQSFNKRFIASGCFCSFWFSKWFSSLDTLWSQGCTKGWAPSLGSCPEPVSGYWLRRFPGHPHLCDVIISVGNNDLSVQQTQV